jgi:hypothetical protein
MHDARGPQTHSIAGVGRRYARTPDHSGLTIVIGRRERPERPERPVAFMLTVINHAIQVASHGKQPNSIQQFINLKRRKALGLESHSSLQCNN